MGSQLARGGAGARGSASLGVLAVLAAVLVAGAAGPAAIGHRVGHPVGNRVVEAGVRAVKSDQPAMPQACGSNGKKCEQELTLSSGSKLDTLANFPLAGSSEVTHALVVVHGTGRNPVTAFTSILGGADKAGVTGRTLVLAPQFKASGDKPSNGEATWTEDGWKQGDSAVSPKGGPSSFEVMDEIVTMLASKQRFPNLSQITVVGHSAGGQFTQRYAAFGMAPESLSGVTFNYVVGNPSSFVYFDSQRPNGKGGGFAEPSGSSCADYDKYKYGMNGRSGYAGRLTPEQAVALYTSRRVTILNGGADTFDNGDLDTDCAANLQGANRAVRGQNFFDRVHGLHPEAPHDRIVVPGVDHDKFGLFASPLARDVLFGAAGQAAGSQPQ